MKPIRGRDKTTPRSSAVRAGRTHTHVSGHDYRVILLAWQVCALGLQVVAVVPSRRSHGYEAAIIGFAALAAAYGSALWVLIRPQLTRAARNIAVLCLGLTPTLIWRATNPLLFTGFDEQLHMRTLGIQAFAQFLGHACDAFDIHHLAVCVQHFHETAHVGALVVMRQINGE